VCQLLLIFRVRPADRPAITCVALSHKMFGGPCFNVFALSYSQSPVILPLMDSKNAFSGVRGPDLETDHSCTSSTEIKNSRHDNMSLYPLQACISWCLDTAATFSITFTKIFVHDKRLKVHSRIWFGTHSISSHWTPGCFLHPLPRFRVSGSLPQHFSTPG